MNCINHSHPDYKDLNSRYPNMLLLDAIISKYQEDNNVITYPSEEYVKKEYKDNPDVYYSMESTPTAIRTTVAGKQTPKEGQMVIYKSGNKTVGKYSKDVTETIIYNINRTQARELKKQYHLDGTVINILKKYEENTATKDQISFVEDLLNNKRYPYGKKEWFSTKMAEAVQRAVRQWRERAKRFRKTGDFGRAKATEKLIDLIQDDVVRTFDNKIDIDGIPVENFIELPIEILGEGLMKFLKHMIPSVNDTLRGVQELIDKDNVNNRKLLADISEYVAYYEPFLDELRGIIERSEIPLTQYNLPELQAGITEILSKFNTIRNIKTQLRVNEMGKLLDEFLAEDLSIDINDPEFREKVKRKLEYDPYTDLENTRTDISTWSFWLGPMKDVSDQLLRIIHKKMFNLNQRIHNAALEYGKKLVNKFKDFAFTSNEWMAERTKKGTYTGFFLSPFHIQEFNEAKDKFFKSLWDEYGLSHNHSDRIEQLEVMPDQELLEFKNKERAWYAENTQSIVGAQDLIRDINTTFGRPLAALWLNKNEVRRYSSDNILYIPSDKWKNKAWDKLTAKQKEQLKQVLEEKRKIDLELQSVLGKRIDPWRMVQISEDWYRIMVGRKGDLFRRLGKNIKEGFIRREDDVDLFGEASTLRPDGSFQRNIPLRWVEPLEDSDTISTDIVGSLVIYNEMWTSFKMKMEELPDFTLLEEQISERNFINERNQIKKGIDTNSFNKVRNFLDMNLSEIRKTILEVDVLGTKINVTKVLNKFAGYVRANNLVNSFFTMGSNFISSTVSSWMEAAVAEHTNKKSYARGEKEFYKNLPGLMQEWAAKTTQSNNKLRLLLEYSKLTGDLGQMFGNLDLGKLNKAAIDSGLYWGYELGDMVVKSKVIVAVLDNHRLHEGKLISYQDFKALRTDIDFFSLPSAYDMIQVKNGVLTYDFSEADWIKIIGKAKTLADAIDGQMSQEDYSAIHQHALFSMVAIHRNWLFSGVYRRLKKKGFNFMMGTIDEGYYRTAISLLSHTFFSADRVNSVKAALTVWNELKPYQKKAVLRVMYDMGAILFFVVVAKMFNKLEADDDDDLWTIDAMAYLSNRALLEVSAFVNPGEYINALRNPFVPARNIEYMMDLLEIFNSDEITKGPWEGYSHRERFFYRLLPGVKGAVLSYDPEYSNNFLKQKPLKWLY